MVSNLQCIAKRYAVSLLRVWWARWESNPRSTRCKRGVITARPRAQPTLGPPLFE